MSKIGIGMVGLGWMGETLLQRFHAHENAEIISVHQRSEQNAKRILAALSLPESLYTSDYQEMLNNPAIDAIVIASTNAHHGPQAISAMKAGKHVFCEKPCAIDYKDFLEQVRLDKLNKQQISFVDYLMNFDSLEDHIKKMTRAGSFGKITQIQVNYRHPVNIGGSKAWKLNKAIMGDAIGMGIVHSLSVMVGIMSEQNAKPVRLYASAAHASISPFESEPVWNIQIEFSDGAQGCCLGNIDHANGYDAYHHIHGTEGGLIFDSYLERPQKIRIWKKGVHNNAWYYPLDRQRCKNEGVEALLWPETTTTPDSGNVVEHQTGACVDHFLNCIKTGTPSYLSFEKSSCVSELAWAAQWSAQHKQSIALPLDPSTLLGKSHD